MRDPHRPLRVALLGCGVVGHEVARLLLADSSALAERIGAPVELAGIAVRRPDKPRGLGVDPGLFTSDAAGLIEDPSLDVVVEVIGGIEPAGSLIRRALENGASVVTANKALLAEDSPALLGLAEKVRRDLLFEAAVGGAIPLIRPLRESLAGDVVNRVVGIVNGTTNFVLGLMAESSLGLDAAVERAQRLGYAEADPAADVEGFDAAAKAAIVSSLAFGADVGLTDVYREGISGIRAADIEAARRIGGVVKLLAVCERVRDAHGRPAVAARVHPAVVAAGHPLAGVGGADNAVVVECESAGCLLFRGAGAGGTPTASAVLGDLVTAGRNRLLGVTVALPPRAGDVEVVAMDATPTRHHVVVDLEDRAGVLAEVSSAFAVRGVSLETVRQDTAGGSARLAVVTGPSPDADVRATVRAVAALGGVRAVVSVLRVEAA